jgi:hypothetical protein
VYGRKTVADKDDSGRIKCIRGTCIIHEFPTSGDQHNVNISSVSKKTTKDSRENRSCFQRGKFGHLKKNCWKLQADKKKSLVTESMGSSSVNNTKF